LDNFIGDFVTAKFDLWDIVGDHIAVDNGFYCGTKLTLGSYVHISANVTVVGGKESELILEDFTFLSAGTNVVCASDTIDRLIGPNIPENFRPNTKPGIVHLMPFSGTFSNVVLAPDVTLGLGSIVAANSFLTSDTEPWTVYAGNPAKPIKKRNKEQILKDAKSLTGIDYEKDIR
jgi:acetyltransferase-like isoleucine patch superfamily enzyme